MTWGQAAEEVGVSPSTMTRTRQGGRMEVDGMLAMVRWLGRTVESFTCAATEASAPAHILAKKKIAKKKVAE